VSKKASPLLPSRFASESAVSAARKSTSALSALTGRGPRRSARQARRSGQRRNRATLRRTGSCPQAGATCTGWRRVPRSKRNRLRRCAPARPDLRRTREAGPSPLRAPHPPPRGPRCR
jgi:hypothetical protein